MIDFSKRKDRVTRVVKKIKEVIAVHGNEKHTPGFVEDTGDTMTGDLTIGQILIKYDLYGANIYGVGYPIYFGISPNSYFIVGTSASIYQTVIGTDGVLYPIQAPTSGAPTYVKGGVYFDTTLNKLRIGGAADWETVTSA